MKHTLIPVLLCLLGTASVADTTPSVYPTSNIESVTVYPDSAKVQRRFLTSVESGESQIVLRYLPTGIDTSNVKIELLDSSSNAVVRDMTFSQDSDSLEFHPELETMHEAIEAAKNEIAKIERKEKLLNTRLSYAESLKESFAKGYGTNEGAVPDAELIEKTWGFYEKTYSEVDGQLKDLEITKQPMVEALEAKEKAFSELLTRLKRTTQSIRILVEASTPTELSFELSYLVRNCSWEPVYEIRAYPETEKVTVRYQVSVYQNSGENWDSVELTLSSARAGSSSHIPDLYPISLNKIEPMVMRKTGAKMMQMQEDAMAFEVGAPAPVAEMAAPSFAANYSSYQVTLPQKFSMVSGQDRKKSLIAEQEVDGEFWTVTAPRLDPTAYLAAEVENTFEMPLLSGESVLFVDDQMVGKSWVAKTAVGEKIELSLGVNENISVERNNGKLNEEDRGIFGKRTRLSRQYFTEVENHSGRAQRIVVKDQFPVSQNEKIEVKQIEPAEGKVEVEANTGLFSWDFELEAGKTKTLETRFEVVYPEDWNIPQNF